MKSQVGQVFIGLAQTGLGQAEPTICKPVPRMASLTQDSESESEEELEASQRKSLCPPPGLGREGTRPGSDESRFRTLLKVRLLEIANASLHTHKTYWHWNIFTRWSLLDQGR